MKNTFSVALGEQVGSVLLWISLYWLASTAAAKYSSVDNFFQNGWGIIPKSTCGIIDYQTVLFWNMLVICTYWIVSIMFTLYDQYNEMTDQLTIKKVYNPGRRQLKTIPWKMVRLANYESFKNTFLSIVVYPALYLPLYEIRGNCDSMWFEQFNTTYDWVVLMFKLAIISYVADFVFYVGHRMFHESKYLYQNFHKLHHQWVDTFAVTATAAHPFEHFMSNLATVMGTPLIIGLPYGITSVFIIIASIHTCVQHSGYGIFVKLNFHHFVVLLKNKLSGKSGNSLINGDVLADYSKYYDFHHDFHHHFQTAEYGTGVYFDKFFKTRLKDQFPKAWKQVVVNCYDNGYVCTSITNDELVELIKEKQKEIENTQETKTKTNDSDISTSDSESDTKDDCKEDTKREKTYNKSNNNQKAVRRRRKR